MRANTVWLNELPTLTGKAVVLRELTVEDSRGDYCDWLNDPAGNQYLETRFEQNTRAALEIYVRETREDPNLFFFAMVDPETGEHVGNIKLGPVNWDHRFGDIGLLIGSRIHWGKGIAIESISLLCDFAFNSLGLNKVTASCYSNNIGSAKAFLKVGFEVEGMRKGQYSFEGGYTDLQLFGRVNPKR